MKLYRLVAFLPVLEDQLATETSDCVSGFIAVIESSRGHVYREGLDVKRPGVEGTQSFVPRRHISVVVPTAGWRRPPMLGDWIYLVVPPSHFHVASEARDCVSTLIASEEACTCHEDGTQSTSMRPIGKGSDPILDLIH